MSKEKEKSAKKSSTKNEKSIKSDKTRKLAAQEHSLWHPTDIARRFDEEIESLRHKLIMSLWEPDWWKQPLAMMWPRSHWTEIKQPLIDIMDNGKDYVIEAELPGIKKEDIDIRLTRNSIEIIGEKRNEEEEEDKDYHRQERSYSRFYRRLPLVEDVKPSEAEATFNNGILEIRLPKENPTIKEKPHHIKIK